MYLHRSNVDPRVWRAPLTPAQWTRAKTFDIPGLKVSTKLPKAVGFIDACEALIKRLGEEWNRPEHLVPTQIFHGPNFRRYQGTGIDYACAALERQGGVIIADGMGLGKTRTALGTWQAWPAPYFPVIIGPAGSEQHWRDEAVELGISRDGLKFFSHQMALSRLEELQETLRANPYMVIVDEIHRMKKRQKAMFKRLGPLIRRCKYRIGLSGTPVDDRVRDLWGPLNLISYGAFGTYHQFSKAYCGGRKDELGHWIDIDCPPSEELKARLKWWMLRRTEPEIMIETGVRKHRNVIHTTNGGYINLAQQIAHGEPYHNKHLVFVRKRETAAKVVAALRAVFPEWMVTAVTGEDAPETRQTQLHAASQVDYTIVVATLDSCAESLNLSWVMHTHFVEFSYRASQILQAEYRSMRLAENPGDRWYTFYVPPDGPEARACRIMVDKLDHLEAAFGQQNDFSGLRERLTELDEETKKALYAELSQSVAEPLFLGDNDE